MPLILHIVYSGLGGTADVAFSLIEAERDARNEHRIAFYGTEPLLPEHQAKCRSLSIEHRSFLRRPRIDPRVNGLLFRWIEKQSPDVIFLHLTTPLSAVIRFKRKKPTVLVVAVEHNSNELKRMIDWYRSARLMQHCDKVVYLSQVYRQQVAEKLGRRFQYDKSCVIPNGIDLDCFRPAKCLSGSRSSSTLTIGMCSRLVVDKDIETLLQAMAEINSRHSSYDIRLTIAGDGPQRASLEAVCEQLKLANVHFAGMLDRRTLAEWYRSLDIYVHATLAETMSLAVMQAMASGLPVVASSVHGMAELVPEAAGMLVPPKQPSDLARSLLLIADDSAKLSSMSEAALAHACSHFSQELAARRYCEVIASATHQSTPDA